MDLCLYSQVRKCIHTHAYTHGWFHVYGRASDMPLKKDFILRHAMRMGQAHVHMYVCTYVCMYIRMYACTYLPPHSIFSTCENRMFTSTYIHAQTDYKSLSEYYFQGMYVCMSVCVYVCQFVHTRVENVMADMHIRTCMYAYMHARTCRSKKVSVQGRLLYVHTCNGCICMYICIYIYIYASRTDPRRLVYT
jgi:hypothetical protein